MAEKKRISIKDIAAALGISITTVSFILNGKAKEKRISDALSRRVLEYVKKAGYRPSHFVRRPKGRVRVLAVLLEDLGDPFYSGVRKHMERIAAEKGYQIIYFESGGDAVKLKTQLQLCVEKAVDGVIVVPTEDAEEVIATMHGKIPVLLFDRFLPRHEVGYVVSDDKQGAFEATSSLLRQGGRRVGAVSLYSSQTHVRGRLEGYLDAMDTFRAQSFICKLSLDDVPEERTRQMRSFIVDNQLDSVFFSTYRLALDWIACWQGGNMPLSSMAVFGDHPVLDYSAYPIAVVVQDEQQLAARALAALIALVDGKQKEIPKISLPCVLKKSQDLIISRPV